MFEGMEKFFWEHSGRLRTLIGSTDTLYHISPVAGIAQLKPLSGDHSGDVDNQDRSKISMADTVHGCVQACFLPGHTDHFDFGAHNSMGHMKKAQVGKRDYELYLYAVDATKLNDTYLACYEMDDSDPHVIDQFLTGEVGYRRTLPCTYMGMIHVRMLTKEEHEANVRPAYIAYTLPTMTTAHVPRPVLDFRVTPGQAEPGDVTGDFLTEDRTKFELRHKRAIDRSIAVMHENVDRISHYYRTGIWKD